MASVTNRTTKQYLPSVNTPDFPTSDWIINSSAADTLWTNGVPTKYWKIVGDVVSEMNAAEKDAVDEAERDQFNADDELTAIDNVEEGTAVGEELRALIETFNKRDNYMVNRLTELQGVFDDIKATTGPADNIRAAIPSSFLATATRTRPDTIQAYKDNINDGSTDVIPTFPESLILTENTAAIS